jgi:hypothetical protein
MKSLSGHTASDYRVENLPVIAFAEFDFNEGGISRYCTASFSFSWNGFSWVGMGGIVSLEAIRETTDVEAVGLKASVAGFDTSIAPSPVALALTSNVQGRTCKIWLGIMNPNYTLKGNPTLEFQGYIDNLIIVEDQGTATMTINMESRFAAILRPNVRRYTDRDQQQVYPGDRYFEFLPQMREKVIVFPTAQAQRR